VELAAHLMPPNGPYTTSQMARALTFQRASFYWQSRQALKDKAVAVAIEAQHERDDTLGHRKLAVLVHVGKNRVKRVRHKYGITARRKKKRNVYPGKAAQVAPNLVRELKEDADSEVLFSAIFELQLAAGSKVRGCFALWKRTRHILALPFDYRMQAELVVSTVRSLQFSVPGMSWHSDQGSQYGAEQTRAALLEQGFQLSMSRAGTPTDNGYAERFVGVFKLAVAERRPYRTLGAFLRAAEAWVNFYNRERPHESLGYRSPNQFAEVNQLQTLPYLVVF
jgi:putative transposase